MNISLKLPSRSLNNPELSHAKWGMYMMNICEFPGVAVDHQLSEL
ncbi:unnamed protein product, partial [Brassica napus]